ncbi:MAG: hypothetical protein PG981_001401 [Wolbachia endosymbiont of Ctenocephalides orientis wCori]|nr:MAG: hypothetical protein PG981_001401 [Wolbachia endosymbiont of Ctenocephalides orientis wCori]
MREKLISIKAEKAINKVYKVPGYNEILFYEADDGKVCIEVREDMAYTDLVAPQNIYLSKKVQLPRNSRWFKNL